MLLSAIIALFLGGLIALTFSLTWQRREPGGVKWIPFTSPNGMCRGKLPYGFEYSPTVLADGRTSLPEWGKWIGDTRVTITTIPLRLRNGESAVERCENSARGLAREWNGFVVESNPIWSNGFEGRHQIIDTRSFIFERHMYVVDQVALIAVALYPEHDKDTAVVDCLLQHFEVVANDEASRTEIHQ